MIAVPCLNRPDLLTRALVSIDVIPDRVLVVDNSWDGLDFDTPAHLRDVLDVVVPGANLGFAGSVNHAIRTNAKADWWCIANADVGFAPGDLSRLADEMAQGGPRWVGITDWRAFGLSFEAVRMAGLWDENYFPAFCEDADYERRCDLVGVPRYFIPGATTHERSVSIRSDERNARHNARTYPSNVAYHVAKWGGPPRAGERFETPFDLDGPVAAWTLDLARIRDNAWD